MDADTQDYHINRLSPQKFPHPADSYKRCNSRKTTAATRRHEAPVVHSQKDEFDSVTLLEILGKDVVTSKPKPSKPTNHHRRHRRRKEIQFGSLAHAFEASSS